MNKRWSTLIASAGILSLALVGCSEGSPSGNAGSDAATEGAEGLTQLTVGILSIAPSVAIQQGIDEGIFAKHGLDVTVSTSNAGAAMLPAVSTGELNLAVGNPLSVITAVSQGLDMKIVTGYSASNAEGDDANGVIVRKDSGITQWSDLAGKTTAVNALRTQGDLTIMESMALDGGNTADLKFSEMPFPDMEAQLERGNIDAMWTPEPFLSRTLEDENNVLLGYPNQEAILGMPTMVSFASGSFAEENPEVMADWKAAMDEILTSAQSDPDTARDLLPDFIQMDPQEAESIVLETWDAQVPTEQLTQLAELAAKYDFIDQAPDISSMIVQ